MLLHIWFRIYLWFYISFLWAESALGSGVRGCSSSRLRALDLWGAHLDAASSPVFAVGLTEGPSFWEVECTPTARSKRAERGPHISESSDQWTDAFASVADALVLPSAASQPSRERSERPTHPRLDFVVFVCFAYVSGCVLITQLCGGGAHLDAASSPVFAVGLTEGPSFWEVECTPTARSKRAERGPHISESSDQWTDAFASVADALVLPSAASQPSRERSER